MEVPIQMVKKVRVVQYGCGPIGLEVAKYVLSRPDIELVGAIDIDRKLEDRDIGDVTGLKNKTGITISPDADTILEQNKPDAVFLTTTSSLKALFPQIEKCAGAGANIISTCEELAYPFRSNPELSLDIDRIAKEHGITVLGTGVNPGFIMDLWPLFMSGACRDIKFIKSARIQDAATRRGPFQKKIGAGCTIDKFNKLVAKGTLKHMGLPESIAMIADGLGWQLDTITETIEPIIAKTGITTDFVTVQPGQAAGVRQIGKGTRAGEPVILLVFEASVGAPESYDAVYIDGVPKLHVTIKDGTHGDIATATITVNCIHRVMEAPAGLTSMKDLPIITPSGIKSRMQVSPPSIRIYSVVEEES
jgi:hypothetical protein